MLEGMMGILSTCLTTSRSCSSSTISNFMTCLSSSIRVGKLKGAQLRTRLEKAYLNLCLMSSRTFEVEGPIIVASTAKIGGGGRGIVVIRASINKVEIAIFIGMKILFLLKK
jgi:hypothetical protein